MTDIQTLSIIWTIIFISTQRQEEHNQLDYRNSWDNEYDYIVVGAGSAGCVVSARLTENPNIKVLLIETGGPQTVESDMPGRQQYLFRKDSTIIWNYPQVSQQLSNFAFINNTVILHKGKGFGGASITNRMNFYRGSLKLYDVWENIYGAKNWSYKQVLPYFLKSENNLDLQLVERSNGAHTTGGPLSVQTITPDVMLERFVTAANILGYPEVDIDGENQYGVSIMQTNIKNGIRQSLSVAFLEPNVYRNNLHILGHTLATRVLFYANKKVYGIEFLRNNKYYTVNASKEVIVSAGPLESPKLLMLSGIGPKQHLQQLNISVISDLKVGDNYQGGYGPVLHFDILNQTDFPRPELNLENKYKYFADSSGPLAYVGSAMMCFNLSLDYLPGIPMGCILPRVYFNEDNLEDIVSNYKLKDQWKEYYRPYLNRAYFALIVEMQVPKSRGTVRLASKNPLDYPLIDSKMYENQLDLEVAVQTLNASLKIYQSDYFKKYAEIYYKPIPGCNYCAGNDKFCDSYLRCVAQTNSNLLIPVGTCKMGSVSDQTAVVDERLRVKGVNGLRVIDSSVMPLISAQMNAVTVMIGERGADFVKEDNLFL